MDENEINNAFKVAGFAREDLYKASADLHKVEQSFAEEKTSFIAKGLRGTNDTQRRAEIDEHMLQYQILVDQAKALVDLRMCEYELARLEVTRVQTIVTFLALP